VNNGQTGDDPGAGSGVGTRLERSPTKLMTIDAGEAAIRNVIAAAIGEHGEARGRGFDELFAMRQAEVTVKARRSAFGGPRRSLGRSDGRAPLEKSSIWRGSRFVMAVPFGTTDCSVRRS
jgi:hypothetical protein